MFFKIIKLSLLLILIMVLSVAGILAYHFQSVKAQGAEYDLAGWLWSEAYGWISLTSDNCAENSACAAGEAYGAKINSNDKIAGYGWSENVGWVCFGSTCQSEGNTPLPDSNVPAAELNQETGQITGWAKVVSLAGDDGWIHLRREAVNARSPALTGEACYDCEPACAEYNQSCDENGENCVNTSCKRYSEDEFKSCKTCFTRTKFDNISYPEGFSGEFVAGGNEYICADCGRDDNRCFESGIGEEKRIVCENSCSACEMYGVAKDSGSGNLIGWAWGGVEISGAKGAGWVHFNPLAGGGFIVYPWLETRYGAIYTPVEVKQRAQSISPNATYCIFADSIRHVSSENCLNAVNDVVIGFPTSGTTNQIYRNALGKIDVDGLAKVSQTKGGKNYNKYGQEVILANSSDLIEKIGGILNNRVFVVEGDLIIDSPLAFNSGVQTGEKGNGAIIVKRNLKINYDISYGSGSPADLKQLASVAWVVKGDVVVSPEVKQIAGAFVVLGKNSVPCVPVSVDDFGYPAYDDTNGCGVFFSGTRETIKDVSLAVYGLVVAKAFDLKRNYTNPLIGSERIIYDGRLIANPPPGLKGFSEGLPVIRDSSF